MTPVQRISEAIERVCKADGVQFPTPLDKPRSDFDRLDVVQLRNALKAVMVHEGWARDVDSRLAVAAGIMVFEGNGLLRVLTDGRMITVRSRLFDAEVIIGKAREFDRFHDDCFVYPTRGKAVAAFLQWDGNGDAPEGWVRNPQTGRRRPDGNAGKEYVRW